MQNLFLGRFLSGATRGAGFVVIGALALIAALSVSLPARSANSECERLRQAVAEASRDNSGSRYQAAAERQRGELDRTVAYSHSLGCENHKFLIFGSDPPPQCAGIDAQISRMRGNLDDLQSRAGGGQGGRGELMARYNAQCGAQRDQRQPGILEALFGQQPREQPPRSNDLVNEPLEPDAPAPVIEKPVHFSEARAGGKAVCVRACDGAFFPVSYSASGGRLDDLEDMCHALCPNADVTLYTYPTSGDIEQAVSITGARYMDSPTALKYRSSFDASCSCKRRGQSWAEALANAESKLGQAQKTDIIVTPEKAAELSRPKLDPKATDAKADPKAKIAKAAAKSGDAIPKPAPGTDVNGVDTTLSEEAATISREASGIAGSAAPTAAPVGEDQGQTVEGAGPNGVKRKVRIVGPTL